MEGLRSNGPTQVLNGQLSGKLTEAYTTKLRHSRKNTKACKMSKRTPVLFRTNEKLKTLNKYIASIPAGVFQHRLIAGSCRPLSPIYCAVVHYFNRFILVDLNS